MQNNPMTMYNLQDFARQAVAAGRKRIGIAFLVERVRWYGIIERRDDDGYKINNNHRAFIARELERRDPSLVGLFTKRVAGSERTP